MRPWWLRGRNAAAGVGPRGASQQSADDTSDPARRAQPATAESLRGDTGSLAARRRLSPSVPGAQRPCPEPRRYRARTELVFLFVPRRWRVRGLSRKPQLRGAAGQRAVRSRRRRSTSTPSTSTRPAAREHFVKQARTSWRRGRRSVKRELGRVLLGLGAGAARAHQKGPLEPKTDRRSSYGRARARRSSFCARPTCSTGSSPTSSAAGWWARRPTSSSGYLAAVSRKLEQPLAVIIQSSSAAGKSGADGSRSSRSCRRRSG